MRQFLHVLVMISIFFLLACNNDQNQTASIDSNSKGAGESINTSPKNHDIVQGAVHQKNSDITKTQPSKIQEITKRQPSTTEEVIKKPSSKIQENTTPNTKVTPPPVADFRSIEWTALMPKEDVEALENPPSYVTDVEDGSDEDQISGQLRNTTATASDDRYQQALASTHVIQEMDGKAIRLPGFIVPLEFDEEQTITQFFLVPFFGACIHLPPPPPNQIILVDYPEGIQLEALYDPFWVSGVIKVELVENDIATAAYVMRMYQFEEYVEPSE